MRSGWTSPAPPTSSPSRWTSSDRDWSTRSLRKVSSETSCCAGPSRTGRRGTPGTPPRTRSTCSPCTASCTCSVTTTPSRRSTRRCSVFRRGCSGSGRGPATGSRHGEGGPNRAAGTGRRARADPGFLMSVIDIVLLVLAAVLVVVAGLFSSADAALSSFSKARAEEIAAQGTSGSTKLLVIAEDPPRYLNTALFLRMLSEIAAIILVTVATLDLIVPGGGADTGPEVDNRRLLAMLVALAVMLVVSFVVIGVAPRTVGR